MNNHSTPHHDLVLASYGGMDQLMAKVNAMLEDYLRSMDIFLALRACGMRPLYMLRVKSPAYISDAIAQRCLEDFDPTESEEDALLRCILEEIRLRTPQMVSMVQHRVKFHSCLWTQYPLESLLRLVWRHRQQSFSLPFYLWNTDFENLSGAFRMEIRQEEGQSFVILVEENHLRTYDLCCTDLSFAAFCQWAERNFRLATEDYGYFVPTCIWLQEKEECL